jgi:Tol biopolymer transport system component
VDRLGGVSPDGGSIAYMNKSVEALTVREIHTGRERHLFSAKYATHTGEALNPVFSPDGKQLAFAWFNEKLFWDLRIVGVDGSGAGVISRDPAFSRIMPVGWTSSGSHVLVIRHRPGGTGHIALVSVPDGAEHVLKSFEGWSLPIRARPAPASDLVAYDRPVLKGSSAQDVFVIRTAQGQDANREIPLVVHPADDYFLGWAPDGRSVFFASDRSGDTDAWRVDVTPQGPAGEPVRVMKNIGRAWPLGFSSGGSFFYGQQTGLTDVYTTEFDIAGLRLAASPAAAAPRFIGANHSPDWSPDGRQIAWVSQSIPFMGRFDVRVMIKTLATGQVRVLSPAVTMVEHFRWSPDGARFLATGLGPDGLAALFTIDAKSGDIALLRRGEGKETLCEPAWRPDGRLVFYKLRHGGVEPAPLISRDLKTGAEQQLLPSVYRYDVSPDGRRLAYSTLDAGAEYIRIMSLPRGQVSEIYRQARASGRVSSVVWTRDQRYLLFSRRGELWRVPVAGGVAAKFKSPKTESLREVRVHPDGLHVAFTDRTGSGELWIVENLLQAAR